MIGSLFAGPTKRRESLYEGRSFGHAGDGFDRGDEGRQQDRYAQADVEERSSSRGHRGRPLQAPGDSIFQLVGGCARGWDTAARNSELKERGRFLLPRGLLKATRTTSSSPRKRPTTAELRCAPELGWHGQINRTIWEINKRSKSPESRASAELLRAQFLQHFPVRQGVPSPGDRTFLFLHDHAPMVLLHGAGNAGGDARRQPPPLRVFRVCTLPPARRPVSWESWVTRRKSRWKRVVLAARSCAAGLGGTVALVLATAPLCGVLWPICMRMGLKARSAVTRGHTPQFLSLRGWTGEVKAMTTRASRRHDKPRCWRCRRRPMSLGARAQFLRRRSPQGQRSGYPGRTQSCAAPRPGVRAVRGSWSGTRGSPPAEREPPAGAYV
jgi:hypothetical protein